MGTNQSVFIVILNWNGWKDTIECLESLLHLDYPNYRCVVVDNGSTDKSVSRILEWAVGKFSESGSAMNIVQYNQATAESGGIPSQEESLRRAGTGQLVLIRAHENLGFARGCNVGIKYALSAGAEYVWLLNNDTVVRPDSLTRLVEFLSEHDSYVAVTPQIRVFASPETIWNCGGLLTWYGGRKYFYAGRNIEGLHFPKWQRVTFITGCALLLRAQLLRQAGLLSEKFFFGEEDYEFSLRMKRLGCKLACVHDAVIYHKVSATVDALFHRGTLGKTYIHYLNRFIHMRGLWPRPWWHAWRIMSSVYIVFMLRRRRAVPLDKGIALVRRLLSESAKLERVDRAVFENAIRTFGEG